MRKSFILLSSYCPSEILMLGTNSNAKLGQRSLRNCHSNCTFPSAAKWQIGGHSFIIQRVASNHSYAVGTCRLWWAHFLSLALSSLSLSLLLALISHENNVMSPPLKTLFPRGEPKKTNDVERQTCNAKTIYHPLRAKALSMASRYTISLHMYCLCSPPPSVFKESTWSTLLQTFPVWFSDNFDQFFSKFIFKTGVDNAFNLSNLLQLELKPGPFRNWLLSF